VAIPNGVDCRTFPFTATDRTPAAILFVGSSATSRTSRRCATSAAPCCRAYGPRSEARFQVVGAYPPEVVRRLGDDPAVEVTGRVDDIVRTTAERGLRCPRPAGLRYAPQNPRSDGERLSVVSTTIGAEGLGATDGAELLIADSAEAMADAIVRLLHDPATSAAIARRARAFVEARFDWDGIATRLLTTYEAALQEHAGHRRSAPEMANPFTFLLPFRYNAMGTILVVQSVRSSSPSRSPPASAPSSPAAKSKA